MGFYDKVLSPAMRARLEEIRNHPDFLTVKPEIQIVEDVIAKLPEDSKERKGWEKTLASLMKTQAKLDKPKGKKKKSS